MPAWQGHGAICCGVGMALKFGHVAKDISAAIA
jgi:hypothetical protein